MNKDYPRVLHVTNPSTGSTVPMCLKSDFDTQVAAGMALFEDNERLRGLIAEARALMLTWDPAQTTVSLRAWLEKTK